MKEALEQWLGANFPSFASVRPEAYEDGAVREGLKAGSHIPEIIVLVGPEGDFSSDELGLALEQGYVPVHLGPSRLRTETAALLCVEIVYNSLML